MNYLNFQINPIKPIGTRNMLLNDNTEPSGRKLVDIGYFFNEIKNIKHEAFDCTFSNFKFEQELRHGFHSTFI